MDLFARSSDGRLHPTGSSLPTTDVTEIVARGPVPVAGSPQPILVLFRDGHEVLRETGHTLTLAGPPPGTYRAEVRMPVPAPLFGHRSATVIYTNRLRLSGE